VKYNGQFLLGTRKEFAEYLQRTEFAREIELIQNHHTYIPSYKHFKGDNHFELLKGMGRAHIERGFSMIAQNITTFPDGLIAICRPIDSVPAGIKGANGRGICIEHLGCFDVGADKMSDVHRETIVAVNKLLCSKFNLVPHEFSIVYHHWYDLQTGKRTGGHGQTKSCPGTAFFGGNTVVDACRKFVPLIMEFEL